MKHTQELIDAAKKMVQDDMGCECDRPMIYMTRENKHSTTFECWSCGNFIVYFKENNNE